jgi:hypothetical protein
MTELIAAGGCYNYMRFGIDEAGGATRNWRGDRDTDQQFHDAEQLILCVNYDGDDMNIATNATFQIVWRNITDAGSWTDLTSSGEIRLAASSAQMVDGTVLVAAERSDSSKVNCTGKGWTAYDANSDEQVNRGNLTQTVDDDVLYEQHWAIDITNADSINGDEYEFAVVTVVDGIIGTGTGHLTVVVAGKIDGTTKDADRGSAVVSVQVTAYLSDEGSPPKPVGPPVAQLISSGSDGTYSLQQEIASGFKYFLHFFKDDTNDLSDGSPEVTAVDRV